MEPLAMLISSLVPAVALACFALAVPVDEAVTPVTDVSKNKSFLVQAPQSFNLSKRQDSKSGNNNNGALVYPEYRRISPLTSLTQAARVTATAVDAAAAGSGAVAARLAARAATAGLDVTEFEGLDEPEDKVAHKDKAAVVVNSADGKADKAPTLAIKNVDEVVEKDAAAKDPKVDAKDSHVAADKTAQDVVERDEYDYDHGGRDGYGHGHGGDGYGHGGDGYGHGGGGYGHGHEGGDGYGHGRDGDRDHGSYGHGGDGYGHGHGGGYGGGGYGGGEGHRGGGWNEPCPPSSCFIATFPTSPYHPLSLRRTASNACCADRVHAALLRTQSPTWRGEELPALSSFLLVFTDTLNLITMPSRLAFLALSTSLVASLLIVAAPVPQNGQVAPQQVAQPANSPSTPSTPAPVADNNTPAQPGTPTTQTTTGDNKQSALDQEFSAPCVSYDSNGMGPDARDRRGFDANGLDKDGYDQTGFNKDGKNRDGLDQRGYDASGKYGLDKDGYDAKGFNLQGFNREGYNAAGFNADGYDKSGYDRNGLNKNGVDRSGNGCQSSSSNYSTSNADDSKKLGLPDLEQKMGAVPFDADSFYGLGGLGGSHA
ncbi:hypothetical protein RTBOTA2_001932 [Rhodotorula toruloides]|nr:hypothetical protein RTBOTA2_001932 [Rhodotorula toruloides]